MTEPDDKRRLLLTALIAIWVLAYGYSFVAFATTEPDGDGFTRGANRVAQFLGWQGMAGILAIAVFGVSRAWPKRSGVRRLATAPLVLALLLVAAIAGVIAWARFAV
ncbi:MAG: hypothetical protein AAGA06_02970 [Pseudomonadota bacterium]